MLRIPISFDDIVIIERKRYYHAQLDMRVLLGIVRYESSRRAVSQPIQGETVKTSFAKRHVFIRWNMPCQSGDTLKNCYSAIHLSNNYTLKGDSL